MESRDEAAILTSKILSLHSSRQKCSKWRLTKLHHGFQKLFAPCLNVINVHTGSEEHSSRSKDCQRKKLRPVGSTMTRRVYMAKVLWSKSDVNADQLSFRLQQRFLRLARAGHIQAYLASRTLRQARQKTRKPILCQQDVPA